MTFTFRPVRCLLAGLLLSSMVAGCKSTPANDAVKLDGTEFPVLGPYKVITVAPFAVGPKVTGANGLGQQLAEDVGSVLRSRYGAVFPTVRVGQPMGKDNEMVVSGLIESFEPGGPGAGNPKLDGQMRLQDASDGEDLAYATFSELRRNAGGGEAATAPALIAQTGAAIAFNLARAKGWRPPATP